MVKKLKNTIIFVFIAVFLASMGLLINTASASGAPVIVSANANNIYGSSVTLSGFISPNSAWTNAWFEYGTTQSLGSQTAAFNLGTGLSQVSFSANLTDLSTGAFYYYQAVASNDFGTSKGNILNFTTYGYVPQAQGAPQVQGNAPSVFTGSASLSGSSSTVLTGSVNPNGYYTTAWFEYGTTQSLGSSTSTCNPGSGYSLVNFSSVISNLLPNTTYYYRAAASNNFGASRGNIVAFNVGSSAAPVDTSGLSSSLAQLSSGLSNLSNLMNNVKQSKIVGEAAYVSPIVTSAATGDFAALQLSSDKSKIARGEEVTLKAEINPKTMLTKAVLEIDLDPNLQFGKTSVPNFTKSENTITFDLGRIPSGSAQIYTLTATLNKDFKSSGQDKDKLISTATFSYADANGSNPASLIVSDTIEVSESGFFASIANFFSGLNLWIIAIFLAILLIIGAVALLK